MWSKDGHEIHVWWTIDYITLQDRWIRQNKLKLEADKFASEYKVIQ